MKLAFYKAFQPNASSLDKVIAVATFGNYSHIEIVFSDDEWFSISAREGITRFKDIHPKEGSWDFIELDFVDEDQEKIVRQNAKNYLGFRYDYVGALFSATPLCIQKDKKMFCSEVVGIILSKSGIIPLGDGCKYSPNGLYKKINNYLD